MNRYVKLFSKFVSDPRMRFNYLNAMGLTKLIDDENYIKRRFRLEMGYELKLDEPETFNEKIQWLKLHDRDPLYTVIVDKYLAKKYASLVIGEKYLIPTLGVWEHFEDIDFDKLPNSFVLKTTHDSKGVVIVRDKNTFAKKKAQKFLNHHLKINFYDQTREWPYKYVTPRIIAEKYMGDDDNQVIDDYKVLCFEGEAKLIELHQGRFSSNHFQDFYTVDWERTEIRQAGLDNAPDIADRPALLDEMIEKSQIFAHDFHLLRVDWYMVGGQLYLGELTFYDASGFDGFDRIEDDRMLGSWIKLPIEEKKLR